MKEILKSHIHPRPYHVKETLEFKPEDFPLSSPIRDIKDCRIEGNLYLDGGIIRCSLAAEANLLLEDSYTAKTFWEKKEIEEDFDILEDEDGEGEGFIVPGPAIDLNELIIALYRFSLPSKILSPGSRLQKGGDGYSVLSEEEAKKQAAQSSVSPFDCIKDSDLE